MPIHSNLILGNTGLSGMQFEIIEEDGMGKIYDILLEGKEEMLAYQRIQTRGR